jgi:uncharacterized membrane protein
MLSDFPSLHPLIVHFPIVLILLAVVFQGAVTWGNWQQIRWATLFIMGAAFFAALAASTVFHAMPSDDAPKEAMEMFEMHETFASYTLWMSGITFLLRCIGEFFKIFRRPYEILVLVSAVITATFLSIAGHHGARLTHIAGVGPMGRYLMKDHHGSGDMKDMDHMKVDSTMQKNDAMPGMKDMPEMDTVNSMNDMENMPGMEKEDTKKTNDMSEMKTQKTKNKQDMKDMPGMDKMKTTKDMKKSNNMEDMPGMDNEKDNKKMKDTDNMKNMGEMKGMDKKNDMKDMAGMDTTKAMKGMDMPGMKMSDMNMKSNPMDTFRFEDNNPAYQKSKKKSNQ